jgi:monoamine oxidase
MQHQYDVIVLGAGISGLRTARDLGKAGKTVLVLEAQSRLGGRVYFDRFADTEKFVEFGGGWFNVDFQPELKGEIDRYSLPIALNPKPAAELRWRINGSVTTGRSPVPLEYIADMERGLYETIHAARRIEFGTAWDRQELGDLDISWEAFVKNLHLPTPVEEFFLTWCSSSEPEDTNALDILSWITGFDSSPWRTYAESMIYHFANGTKSLVDALAKDSGADIRLDSPVVRVEHGTDGVTVTTRGGETFSAAAGVVALPINVWPDIDFEPALSVAKQEVSAEVHPGRTVKVWAVLENAPKEGFSGWGRGEGLNWLFRFDELPEGDLYVGFSGGYDLDPTDPDAIQRAVAAFDPDAKVVKFGAHDWRANEFEKGTWLIRRPGEGQRHHSEVPAREGDLVFGGSDTSFGWNGWMEGALETGGRAAAEVLDVLAKADGRT